MKILHVISSLSPEHGGPPEMTRHLASVQQEETASVEIVCQDPPTAEFLSGITCPVHALDERWLGHYSYSPKLSRWLDENIGLYDGVLIHGIWTFQSVAVRRYARKHGVEYCVFVHGALDPWFKRRYPLKHIKKMAYWIVQYPVLRDAFKVFFLTSTEMHLAKTSFQPNTWNGLVFPYGILKPKGDSAAQTEMFYERLPALRGRRFLLFLARLHPKKGCDLLLKAFAKFAPSIPDVDLVMAGPDQVGWQAALMEMANALGIADRVHWPGLIAGDEKWGALHAAEAFILPSHQENFGIAVVESLAAGRPVLLTSQVNIWKEIQTDGCGLVEPDTQDGIERLLQRWFDMPAAERAAMAAATGPSFDTRYSLREGVASINGSFTGQR